MAGCGNGNRDATCSYRVMEFLEFLGEESTLVVKSIAHLAFHRGIKIISSEGKCPVVSSNESSDEGASLVA